MKYARNPQRKMLLLLSMVIASVVLSAQVPVPATVHIYRYRLSVEQTRHPKVSCDAFPVARMQNGRVYAIRVSPGWHVFATMDDPTGIRVDIMAGKEYFVRIDYPVNSTYSDRATATLVAPEQGRMEILKLRALDGQYIEASTCGNP
ncbi:MAG TPA: hypothetical protein VGL82_16935 [Bryobacteraceae bacterium]